MPQPVLCVACMAPSVPRQPRPTCMAEQLPLVVDPTLYASAPEDDIGDMIVRPSMELEAGYKTFVDGLPRLFLESCAETDQHREGLRSLQTPSPEETSVEHNTLLALWAGISSAPRGVPQLEDYVKLVPYVFALKVYTFSRPRPLRLPTADALRDMLFARASTQTMAEAADAIMLKYDHLLGSEVRVAKFIAAIKNMALYTGIDWPKGYGMEDNG